MTTIHRDPWLLTPGPLTTSATVKQAMLRDWGSRDARFIAINREVRERLLAMAGGEGTHVCVPVQGSGTFAVEAAIGTLLARDARMLVLVNGAYGQRIVRICQVLGRGHEVMTWPEDQPVCASAVRERLEGDPTLGTVMVVHCETTSGILNDVQAVAEVCGQLDRRLFIDAMSAFGAIELDARRTRFDCLVASSNKCIEGAPGMGFAVIRRSLLEQCKGNAHSLTLDLEDQWQAMEKNGQWRFTPPTHVIAAFHQALLEHAEEGGVAGRGVRYRRNCEVLVSGMRELGFRTLLPDALQAPIIITFHMPADPAFDFQRFYDALAARGFVIYPGKLTVADSFRIGCIGRLGEAEMRAALHAIRAVLDEMGVRECAPAAAA